MEKEQIEQLKQESSMHNHSSQIKLGEYYLNSHFSNSNFSRAQTFLRMAAEKHQENGIKLLVSLYTKYMEYYIKENQLPKKVTLCLNLGVKWCKIGSSLGFDFIKEQNYLIETYAKASHVNDEIDINYKFKAKFKFFFIMIYIAITIFFILTILVCAIDSLRNEMNILLTSIPLGLLLIFLLIYRLAYKRVIKNNDISTLAPNSEEIKNSTKINDTKKLGFLDRLKAIFNFENPERENLTAIQRGLLGECFVEFLNYKKAKVLFSSINKKLLPYGEKIKKIEWVNRGVETSDPFDFLISTVNDKKFYFDVKTSWNESNVIFMSNLQKNFCEKTINHESTYFICKLNNFWYKNIDDFQKVSSRIKINIYDLKIESDKEQLKINYHPPSNFK